MCSVASPTSETKRVQDNAAILCVDDSQNMLIICQTMLEASGYNVHTANNGEAALQILGQHPIDLVILDNRMPGMSGVELAKEIKRFAKDLPVVMFSDSGHEPSSTDSIDLFMNKMRGPRALCNAVGSLLRNL
jgi:CheY-like chemotaxis protein